MHRSIIDVSEKDFNSSVIKRSFQTPIMVDFWAQWCSPCIQLNPVLVRVAKSFHGKLILAKVEVDDNMHLAGHYHLAGFPSVLLIINGVEVARFAGAKNEHFVREFLGQHGISNSSTEKDS